MSDTQKIIENLAGLHDAIAGDLVGHGGHLECDTCKSRVSLSQADIANEVEPDSVRALREVLADSDIANAYGVAHPGRVIRASRALLDALPGLLAEAWDAGYEQSIEDHFGYGEKRSTKPNIVDAAKLEFGRPDVKQTARNFNSANPYRGRQDGEQT